MKFAYLIEPSFNYISSIGEVTGCDVEVARYVISHVGTNILELVEAEFSELLPGLSRRRWRMTTGLFDTPERRNMSCFSRPIWALRDGLLVRKGNPLKVTGYQSIADNDSCTLSVIKDQFQHRSAVGFGIPQERVKVFNTYLDAAQAVRDGVVDVYASVERAHEGFLAQNADWDLDIVGVPVEEKSPEFGCFAFALGDEAFRDAINAVLEQYLGSEQHRQMMNRFGFSDQDVDLVIDNVRAS